MKTLAIAFVLSLFTSFIYAQEKSNEDRAKKMTGKMKTDLSLTDDQYLKAYPVNLAFVNKASEIRNSGGGKLGMARKLKSADAERDKMLKGVLSEEQFKKYTAQKAENRNEMKKRFKGRKG